MCSEIASLSAWRYCALRWKRAFGNLIKVAFFSLIAATLLGASAIADEGPKQASQISVLHQAWLGPLRTRATVSLGQAWMGGATWRSDSKRVAVYLSFGNGFVLDRESSNRVVALPPPESSGSANDIRYTPDDKFILLSGQTLGKPQDASVALTLVDGETGAIVREISGLVRPAGPPFPLLNTPRMIALDPERSEIVLVPSVGEVGLEIFDPKTWQPFLRRLSTAAGNEFALRPRSREIAFISGRGTVRIMDRLSGDMGKHFQALPADVTSIAYSPDGSLLLTAMRELGNGRNDMPIASIADAQRHSVVGWRTDGYTSAGAIDVTIRDVYSIQFHPDGAIFAVGSFDEVLLFDSSNFRLVARIPVHTRRISSLAFSPDGGTLAVGGTLQFELIEPAL